MRSLLLATAFATFALSGLGLLRELGTSGGSAKRAVLRSPDHVLRNAWTQVSGEFASSSAPDPEEQITDIDDTTFPSVAQTKAGDHVVLLSLTEFGGHEFVRVVQSNWNVEYVSIEELADEFTGFWPIGTEASESIEMRELNVSTNFAMHDWGVVDNNTTLRTDLVVFNRGSTRILLDDFEVSCSCVQIPSIGSQVTVEPDSSYTLPIEIRFGGGESLAQSLRIRVSSDHLGKSTVFSPTLFASGAMQALWLPSDLDFGVAKGIRFAKSRSIRIRESFPGQLDIDLDDVRSTGPVSFHFDLQKYVAPNTSRLVFRLSCTPKHASETGDLSGEVLIDVSPLSNGEIAIPYLLSIYPPD